MSVSSLSRRRFELFYYLLTGVLLPKQDTASPQLQDDETEEKMPPPQEADQVPAESAAPSTHVASCSK